MATLFPIRAKRGDVEDGYMVVQQMVEFLRDAFDSFVGKIVRGSATVAAATTTVTVSLPSTMAVYSVVVTPTLDPAGRFWVSGKTSSQFVINLSAAAPVGGIPFDWIARAA